MDSGSRPPLTEESRAPLGEESRPLARISDDDLLRRLAEILSQSRRVETDLVAHIAEVDERRLYAREAFPSMFAYCTQALHLSESEAYLRIAVARASRQHPMILPMLDDGRLHLSGIAQLAPHLAEGNREALLRRATHRSKRQIEGLIAEVAPRPDVPALMRKLPDRPTRPEATPTTASGMGRSVTPSPVHLAEASGPAALTGPRRRSRSDPRSGRHRDARPARSPPLRHDEPSPEGPPEHRYLGRLAPRPRACPAGGARA
jgi:hypothetical protein